MARSEQIASLFASVGFKIDQRSVQSLDKSLANIENRVNRLRQNMLGVKAGKNYGDAFKGLERQATGAATALDAVHKKYRSGIAPLQAYTVATQNLAIALSQVRNSMPTRLPTVPRGNGGGGGGFSRNTGSSFSNAAASLFGLGGLGGLALGSIPALAGGWAISQAVKNGRAMQSNQLAFQALRGSEGGGREESKYIKDFSYQYGLNYKDSAEGYKRILASSQGTALQGDGARSVFQGVSLYGKTLGLSNENMSRASTAISQMISKGKVSSEELKGQLAEALPGAVQIFAKALGKPVAEMFKMMEAGEVLSADILPKVAKLLEEQANSGGALQKSLENSMTAQNRLSQKWAEMMQKIYEGGLDKLLAGILNTLTGIISIFTEIPQFIWYAVAAVGALHLALKLLPLAMILRNFILIQGIAAGIFGVGAIAGIQAFARAIMVAMAPVASFLWRTFFPIIIIMDTLESLFTGKVGLIGAAAYKSGGVEAFRNFTMKAEDFFGINSYDANAEKPGASRKPPPGPGLPVPMPKPAPNPILPPPYKGPLAGQTNINIQIDGSKDPTEVGREVHRQLVSAYEGTASSFPHRLR